MPNKTLYVRDEDMRLWEEAEALVKDKKIESLSKLVTDSIRKELNRIKEFDNTKQGHLKTIVDLATENGTRKIGFNGKWLVTNYDFGSCGKDRKISVAITEKGAFFTLQKSSEDFDEFEVYDHFEVLTKNGVLIPEEVKSIIASKIGEDYVEFLDI